MHELDGGRALADTPEREGDVPPNKSGSLRSSKSPSNCHRQRDLLNRVVRDSRVRQLGGLFAKAFDPFEQA